MAHRKLPPVNSSQTNPSPQWRHWSRHSALSSPQSSRGNSSQMSSQISLQALAGQRLSSAATADRLNAEGTRTRYGCDWKPEQVRRVVQRRA